MIILILIGVALVSGMLFGFFGDLLGLPPSVKSGGMAAPVAILAAILVARRRSAVSEQKDFGTARRLTTGRIINI